MYVQNKTVIKLITIMIIYRYKDVRLCSRVVKVIIDLLRDLYCIDALSYSCTNQMVNRSQAD